MLAAPPFSLLDTLSAVDDAIDGNADLADAITELATNTMGLPSSPPKDHPDNWRNTAKPSDHSKAHSTIRQFYRDWTAEGYQSEVKPLLDLILSDLSTHLHHHPNAASSLPDILLPGAGLARLLLQLTLAGNNATGNEISYHQLLASNFILNSTPAANSFTIHPFCTTFTNVTHRSHQLRSYTIPDIHPATATHLAHQSGQRVGEMGMAAGDFITSFNDATSRDAYDALATVYFLDTAPNLLRYIETIAHCLKPGGLWINIGPLLWHFDDRSHAPPAAAPPSPSTTTTHSPGSNGSAPPTHNHPHHHSTHNADADEDTGIAQPGSFELSNDEVLHLVTLSGFDILSHEILPADFGGAAAAGAYIQDPESMMQSRYRCAHWVARRRTRREDEATEERDAVADGSS